MKRIGILLAILVPVASWGFHAAILSTKVASAGIGPQQLDPASTVTANSWTASSTTLHGDTSDGSDSTKISNGSTADNCELALDSGSDPTVHTGHTVSFRANVTGGSGGPERFDVWLYEGTTLIATPFNNIALTDDPSWTTHTYTLIAVGEADQITDYTDLRLRFTASALGGGETMHVSQMWLDLP